MPRMKHYDHLRMLIYFGRVVIFDLCGNYDASQHELNKLLNILNINGVYVGFTQDPQSSSDESKDLLLYRIAENAPSQIVRSMLFQISSLIAIETPFELSYELKKESSQPFETTAGWKKFLKKAQRFLEKAHKVIIWVDQIINWLNRNT